MSVESLGEHYYYNRKKIKTNGLIMMYRHSLRTIYYLCCEPSITNGIHKFPMCSMEVKIGYGKAIKTHAYNEDYNIHFFTIMMGIDILMELPVDIFNGTLHSK